MIRSNLNKFISPAQLLCYTGIAGILISILIFGSSNLIEVDLVNSPSRNTIILIFLTTVAVSAGLFAFVVDAALEDRSIHIPVACLAAAAVGILELSILEKPFAPQSYFYLTFLLNAVLVHCTSIVVIQAMQLRGHWPSTIAVGNTVALSMVGLACILSQSWISLEVSAKYIVTVRSGLVAVLPVVCLTLFASVKSLHVNSGYMRESLLLRLQASRRNSTDMGAVVIACMIALTVCLATILAMRREVLNFPVSALTSIVPLALWYSYWRAKQGFAELSQQSITAALAPPSAKKFLKRHMSSGNNWSTSVGLRTPNFIIDHDPDGLVSDTLPASVAQIRNIEIERCITQLLGPAYLHNRVMGSQIFGTIDPELSLRPCVDVLMMFAGLHLDAVQLVERRLSGLVSLLPILDPELSRRVDAQDIDRMLTRDIWIYHFDYSWADQQVMRTNQELKYGVHHDLIPSTFRVKVFEYLKRKNRIGNFIWIGASARERLLQEAPMLSQIIQAWPVPTGEQEESLVFLIKFEELIPRLQKYFGLEEKRVRLQDYDPSPEAIRFLNVVELQLQNSNSLHSLYQVISSLVSFPWRGFREKDLALHAVKRTYLQSVQALATLGLDESEYSRQHDAIRAKFISAIAQIGYPSQVLHVAQLKKIAMREPQTIIQNASQPWNPRFHESWLLISSFDANRFSSQQIEDFLKFFLNVPDLKYLHSELFVQCKAIEAFVNLGAKYPYTAGSILEKIADRFARWLVDTQAPVDVCILFLDGLQFLEQQIEKELSLPEATIDRLDRYFHSLSTLVGPDAHGAQAIFSRWHRNGTDEFKAVS